MSGMVTAGLLVVIVVGFFVGAFAGLILGTFLPADAILAMICGVVGVVAAGLARNAFLRGRPVLGPGDGSVPTIVLLFAAVASIAGSLSGYYVATLTGQVNAWAVGALAGLFSAVLQSLLIIAYVMDPSRSKPTR